MIVKTLYCPSCGGEWQGEMTRKKFRVYNDWRRKKYHYKVEYTYDIECEKCHYRLFGDDARYEFEAFRQDLT